MMAEPALCGLQMFQFTKWLTVKRDQSQPFSNPIARILSMHKLPGWKGPTPLPKQPCKKVPFHSIVLAYKDVECAYGMVNWQLCEVEKRLPYLKFNLRWAAYWVAELSFRWKEGHARRMLCCWMPCLLTAFISTRDRLNEMPSSD